MKREKINIIIIWSKEKIVKYCKGSFVYYTSEKFRGLIRSCDIRQIKELTGSKSNKDFKRDVIKDNSFHKKLLKHNSNFQKFWISSDATYKCINNDAERIKLRN